MQSKKPRHLLSITDLTQKDLEDLMYLAGRIKSSPGNFSSRLKGRVLGLLFNKPSTRTRVSFEAGMYQLGGNVTFLTEKEIQLQRGESIKDTAIVLSRYIDGIVIRTFEHQILEEFSQYATIPVINGLTDLLHPCQILSDLFTIKQRFNRIKGITVTFIGDGSNNITHSWLLSVPLTGINLKIVTPPEFMPDEEIFQKALKLTGETQQGSIRILHKPEELEETDILYTDVWVSMGQEEDSSRRKRLLAPYQVNSTLIQRLSSPPLIMHCLPAHLGEEITGEVMYGPFSVVFEQAENRLHLQKALLIKLLEHPG